MNGQHRIDRAARADYDRLADVMFDAVRNGPGLYDEQQRRCWVPDRPCGRIWHDRLDRQAIVVGRDEGGIAGFMSLAPGGYVDLAFVRPRARGTGLFRAMVAWIEGESRARGDARLWVHASLTAIPAFTATGFRQIADETVEVRGAMLRRAVMEKAIVDPDEV